jgi:hypothetical protein
MANDIRERAKEYLKAVPPLGQQITSTGATAALFTKLTGVTQATLEANWANGGIMTTCNEFVGHYGKALGSKDYLGRFDIDAYLKKVGKGHAWAPRTADARPKYGDVFLLRDAKHLHMGVSLDFEGDQWNTVESGQGGPKMKCDVIKRKQQDYNGCVHIGWVDLELYFDAASQLGAVPDWLVGWWTVTWRGQTYYYYFDRNRQVKWTQGPPDDASKPPPVCRDTGSFGVEGAAAVTVRWGGTGSVEKFGLLPAATAELQMGGTWNGTEPLTAVKM